MVEGYKAEASHGLIGFFNSVPGVRVTDKLYAVINNEGGLTHYTYSIRIEWNPKNSYSNIFRPSGKPFVHMECTMIDFEDEITARIREHQQRFFKQVVTFGMGYWADNWQKHSKYLDTKE